jgi:hypothetical protein
MPAVHARFLWRSAQVEARIMALRSLVQLSNSMACGANGGAA